jgi:predicted CoA-binding protein
VKNYAGQACVSSLEKINVSNVDILYRRKEQVLEICAVQLEKSSNVITLSLNRASSGDFRQFQSIYEEITATLKYLHNP